MLDLEQLKKAIGIIDDAITCDEAIDDKTLLCVCRHFPQLVAEVERLRATLDDINETHRIVMNELCASDEKHCTCVPILREENERLLTENLTLLRQVNLLITSCYYRTKAGKVHWKQGQYFGTSAADHTQPEAYLQAMEAIRRNAGIPSDEDAGEDEEGSDDPASESPPNTTCPLTQADFAALIVSMMLPGFKWETLPNGERGWRWDGYLRDAEMKELYQWIGKEPRKELAE